MCYSNGVSGYCSKNKDKLLCVECQIDESPSDQSSVDSLDVIGKCMLDYLYCTYDF